MSEDVWYFRPLKKKCSNGTFRWSVCEFYPKCGHTGEIIPYGETKQQLIQTLKWMLKDIQKYKPIVDNTK